MIQQNVKTRVMFVPNILETTLIATDHIYIYIIATDHIYIYIYIYTYTYIYIFTNQSR